MTACSACGKENLPGEIFCQNCGVILAPVPSLPPPLPLSVQPDIAVPLPDSSPPPLPVVQTIPGCLVFSREGVILHFPPGKAEIIIGRSDPASAYFPDIDLTPLAGEAAGVSRRHARLVWVNGQVHLEDLNSTNFTFLNHAAIPPFEPNPVYPGDLLQFGRLTLQYEDEPDLP